MKNDEIGGWIQAIKERPRVYIRGPYVCGRLEQYEAGKQFVQLLALGFSPFSPSRSFATPIHRYVSTEFAWLSVADAAFIPDDSNDHVTGKIAEAYGIPVFTTLEALAQHFESRLQGGEPNRGRP